MKSAKGELMLLPLATRYFKARWTATEKHKVSAMGHAEIKRPKKKDMDENEAFLQEAGATVAATHHTCFKTDDLQERGFFDEARSKAEEVPVAAEEEQNRALEAKDHHILFASSFQEPKKKAFDKAIQVADAEEAARQKLEALKKELAKAVTDGQEPLKKDKQESTARTAM
eukprot:1520296-Amphidinium_carterae.1